MSISIEATAQHSGNIERQSFWKYRVHAILFEFVVDSALCLHLLDGISLWSESIDSKLKNPNDCDAHQLCHIWTNRRIYFLNENSALLTERNSCGVESRKQRTSYFVCFDAYKQWMKQQSFAKENKYLFIECQFVIRIYPNEKKNKVIKNCIDKYYSAFLLSCEFKVHIDKNSSLFNNERNFVSLVVQ